MVDKQALDRWITGNYGEDQFREDAYDCKTCGAEESVTRKEHGRVCSVWECAECGQDWVWENDRD